MIIECVGAVSIGGSTQETHTYSFDQVVDEGTVPVDGLEVRGFQMRAPFALGFGVGQQFELALIPLAVDDDQADDVDGEAPTPRPPSKGRAMLERLLAVAINAVVIDFLAQLGGHVDSAG